MKTYNIALLGAGKISREMALTVNGMQGVNLYAVAARELSRAQAFAQEWNVDKAYGSYEEMLEDEAVDLVYVATPHSHHAEHAKLCISYGKPVLCEKAFTGNAKQAREVLDYAKEKGVFITEAIWPRYMPLAKKLQQLIAGGAVGEVNMVTAAFGFAISDIARMGEPALAGGALLDLGIYPITFASTALGSEVESIESAATLTEKGVDAFESITLRYPGGKLAVLYANQLAELPNCGVVYGDAGRIEVHGPNDFACIKVFDKYGITATYAREEGYTGYEYEVQACIDALEQGKLECPDMPHAETLRIMQLMDGLRAEWGVRYPFD